MKTCWLCEIKPVESKVRPLCKSCFQHTHKHNLLHLFPKINRKNKIENLIKKYGIEIKEDFINLKNGLTTLNLIGIKHGVTRERIRQIYQIYYGETYTNVVKARSRQKEISKKEAIIEQATIDSRVMRYKKGTNHYLGIIALKLFNDKCKELRYDVEIQNRKCFFNAKVNGLLVDIASRSEAYRFSCSSRNLYYNFHIHEKQWKYVDVFPCYLFDEDSWYILPKSSLTGKDVYIPKYDLDTKKNNRYRALQPYREAWHLLAKISS